MGGRMDLKELVEQRPRCYVLTFAPLGVPKQTKGSHS